MLKENDIISNVLLTIKQYKGNLNHLKKAVIEKDYNPKDCKHFSRVLIWKSCLITGTLKILEWESNLNRTRVIFHQLRRREDLIPPWWELESDNVFYQPKETLRKPRVNNSGIRRTRTLKNSLTRESGEINPLRDSGKADVDSKNDTSNIELLRTIIMDIDRLFPGEEFFATSNPDSLEHKKSLIEVLFIWSKCNSKIGYKQGIHEIMGLIYLNLYRESIIIPSTNTITADDLKILSLYDKHYLSHDLFTIFNKFMFDSCISTKFFESEEELAKFIDSFNANLMKVDQLIHYNLINKLKLESQLWIIRYCRLILLREFDNDFENLNLLWDKLICLHNVSPLHNSMNDIPQIIIFVIIVLLIQVKSELITCDFSESLILLLHYPMKAKMIQEVDFVHNLFKHAIKLFESKDKDLKLYEYGIKLNKIYNPNLKISMSYNGTRESFDSGRSSLSRSTSLKQAPPKVDEKVENLKFEKLRLEMRLKKKAQQLLNS